MEYDREVIRDEELAAREAAKKKRFTLFKNKPASNPQSTSSSTPTAPTNPSPLAQTDTGDEDDLPARTEGLPSANTKPNHRTEDESVSHIPAKAGFDFTAIAKVIGKEDLDPSALPMVPAESMPKKHPPSEHVALERTGSAPLPLRASLPPEDSNAPTPKPTVLSLPDQPPAGNEDHSLPTAFQRSLSMSDASAFREDRDSKPDIPSADDSYGSSASSKRPQPPSWPPPSAFLSGEGPVWGSPLSNDHSTTVSNLSISNPGPLRRQAPPSISFGALNGVLPASTASDSSTPEISFGLADGSIVPVDGRTRDPWAPKPIGLDAAIARKTNYTLNPWET